MVGWMSLQNLNGFSINWILKVIITLARVKYVWRSLLWKLSSKINLITTPYKNIANYVVYFYINMYDFFLETKINFIALLLCIAFNTFPHAFKKVCPQKWWLPSKNDIIKGCSSSHIWSLLNSKNVYMYLWHIKYNLPSGLSSAYSDSVTD